VPAGFIDGCSSAAWLAESSWQRPADLVFGVEKCRRVWSAASGSAEPPVVAAQSWLLRSGYRRVGPIDMDVVPG
ncbi:MAG TPA: hypothetical protein VG963_26185, partial [Polyangiaceae bacterium]|nr:hypothetical protein [Polyangiaceae bacterium]